MSRLSCKGARGFTLIELLVVVSIIALLISILLPSLKRARDQAKAATCGTNLHQLGVAMHLYLIDHAHYPGHHTDAGAVAVWPPRLRFYMSKDTGGFWCPATHSVNKWEVERSDDAEETEPGEPYYWDREVPIIPWHNGTFFSYGYNDWGTNEFTRPHLGLGAVVDGPKHTWDWRELPEQRVKVPSDMIAIADSNADGHWDTAIDPATGEYNEWPSKRHYGGSEVLFCDGHARWITQEKLLDTEPENRQRWNNTHKPW